MTTRAEALLWNTFHLAYRRLSGGDGDGDEDDHGGFGVHITYDDLYHSVLFFTAIYLAGQISSRLLRMPTLVGEIFVGILLGPPLADFVPNPEAFVMLGEVGLILLVLEAGIDIDLTTLKLIGGRGVIIAFVGSILPIAIGVVLAFAVGTDTKGALAAGAAFGPTSLGIAMNILRQGKIVNTPVGQLVVSAAVIDDMIALVILSQLSALTGDINVASILIPIVSALCFLCIGGYVAVYVLPKILNKHVLNHFPEQHHAKIELATMFGLLLGLMPATYYAEASFLMGAFVSGLTFCRSHDLHGLFVSQFKRILQWLMRIFFAASIGFQVPIKDFGNGTVIWQGLMFTLALLGKVAVGFMVPNFNRTTRFTGLHMRDCLITGFSMAAEGEFAFVIAVFAVDSELISKDLYASVVLAVLLSTIVPPFLLRYTINRYNRIGENVVRKAAEEEFNRKLDLEKGENMTLEEREKQLAEGIKNHTTVFLCIQTQCDSRWGLLPRLMNTMNKLQLEIIDHRSWHPRGVDTTLVNEIYARDTIRHAHGEAESTLDERLTEVREAIEKTINQPGTARVKVHRWYPGVVAEIVEEVENRGRRRKKPSQKRLTIEERLLNEASRNLEVKRDLQTHLTKEKSLSEILKEVTIPEPTFGGTTAAPPTRRPRRSRQKMRSTPVVGGSLFDDSSHGHDESPAPSIDRRADIATLLGPSGHAAELIVDGEVYRIRISDETLKRVRRGYSGALIDGRGISIHAADAPVEHRLEGFVRNPTPLSSIAEETDDMSECSDQSSIPSSFNH